RARRSLTTAAVALAAMAATATPAIADTYTVNTYADDGSGCDQPPTPGSPCTLRGALGNATDVPGSTVMVPSGTYTLSAAAGALSIPNQTTLQGEGARTTIIDANGANSHDRALQQLDPAFSAIVSHLTITGGEPDSTATGGDLGGNVLSMGTMTLDHVRVTDGAASAGGGVANSGTLTIEHSLLDANRAVTGAGKGGAVSTTGGAASLVIRSSTISGNGGTDSGALDAASTTTLTHVTLAGNRAQGAQPGGIKVATGVAVHVRGSIISGNLSNTGTDLSGSGSPANCSGALTDDGANLESAADCGLSDSSSRQGGDAALDGALSDQGGESDVLALGAGSQAIDLVPNAGCPATDQRDTTRAQGPACDAGAFEAAPAPPPPPPAHEHTLIGAISYFPALAIGVLPTSPNPFDSTVFPSPTDRLAVVLYAANGAVVASRRVIASDVAPNGVPFYRLEGLPSCQNCVVALRNGPGILQAATLVSIDGDAGQTTVNFYLRDRPGGWGFGRIETPNLDGVEHPLPGTPTATSPLDLRVRVLDGRRVVADTAAIRPQCRRTNTPGAYCEAGGSELSYQLTGLPTDNRRLTFELLQTPDRGPAVVVDSASGPLLADASGYEQLPPLTALDIMPASVRGRTLFGTVSYLAPFAPGERHGTLQSLRFAPTQRVRTVLLLRRGQILATGRVTTPSTGESGYRLQNLPACEACTVQLREGPRIVDRATVTIPSSRAVSVTRRDLQLKDGAGHFLNGSILPNGVRPDKIRIVVTDSTTGETITDSRRLPRACRPLPAAQRAAHCDLGSVIGYRLDGVPADKPVTVAAVVEGPAGLVPVDTANLTTSGPDEDTSAPTFVIPPGFDGQPAGRQLVGSIVAGGSFAPGAGPAPLRNNTTYLVRLMDAGGVVVGSTSVTTTRANSGGPGVSGRPLAYKLTNLPPCVSCKLELFSAADMRQQDRGVVTLHDEAVSVASTGSLATQRLVGGPYVVGGLSANRQSALLNDLEVRILGPGGQVVANSRASGMPRPDCGTSHSPCPRRYRVGFALGHAPASGVVTVVVRDFHTRRELARKRVTVVGGGADTDIGTLDLAFER
ncbi:MAG TPA: choice-of-anchor Q domain-containing protein, partial [Gaiellales bacterium]